MINLSVLIASHNGANVLPKVLEGYVQSAKNETNWQLIIVDNCSDDSTSKLIEKYQPLLPIVHLHEPRPGKNVALNTGLRHVAGDFVVISDDDAIPEPGFIDAWRTAAETQSDIDVFGGTIRPEFEVLPPEWMLEGELKFEELYAQRKNLAAGRIAPSGIFGPNMAVRRRVFAAGIRFNEDIGPNHNIKQYSMGSETEFCEHAAACGFTTGFNPLPEVRHIVRAHQVSPEFWSARAYRLGRGVAKREQLLGRNAPKHFGKARRLGRAYLGNLKLTNLKHTTPASHPARNFLAEWDYNFQRGYISELMALNANQPKHVHSKLQLLNRFVSTLRASKLF